MSKTESIPVARSDKESDEMAAYTARSQYSRQDRKADDLLCRTQRLRLARRLAQTAILTYRS